MERKIGEIFEIGGEWYQCMKSNTCNDCAFYRSSCGSLNDKGSCRYNFREDATNVIFKKLEKVGKPFYRRWTLDGNNKLMQRYKTYTTPLITIDKQQIFYNLTDDLLEIEVKQNKEDMEEKKSAMDFVVTPPRLTGDKPEHQLNLKSFDLQKAKEGKPVCTRDGRKARIICFDRVTNTTNEYTGHLIVLVTNPNGDEQSFYYTEKGNLADEDEYDNHKYDLMMLSEKKEGWVNVYNSLGVITFSHNPYDTKEEALASETEDHILNKYYVDTVKVEWEE